MNKKSTNFGLKYINNIMKRIPFKPITTPCTAKHSRKPSNDMNDKKNNNNNNIQKNSCFNVNIISSNNTKLKQSQSTSLSKIKNIIIPNTNDLRSLLSKYSIVSHLTSQSTTKHNNKTYFNTNNNNINVNNNSLSKSYIKQTKDMQLIPSSSYQAKTLFSHNGHKFNLKIQSSTTTKQNLKQCLPVTLPTTFNKKTEDNINIGANKTMLQMDGEKKIKNSSQCGARKKPEHKKKTNKCINNKMYYSNNIFSKKHGIDFIFAKFPHFSQAKTQNNTNINVKKNLIRNENIKRHSNSNSSSKKKHIKNNKTVFGNLSSPKVNLKISYNSNTHTNPNTKHISKNIINDSSLSNQSFSTSREANYYKNESKKLIEYIKNYASNHNYCEYPKTTINFYRFGRRVGHGAFGKVNIGLHILSGHIVAIKSFNKSKQLFSKSKINYEVKLMKKLRGHKSIVKLFEYIETEKYNCIIMENVPGGNLLTLIRKRTKLSEQISKYIFRQLMEALKYIHSQGIAHRDIKPDNILIDLNNTIKLCDFGVGKEIKPGQLIRDTCGTPAFVAPEIFSEAPYDPFQTDVWSSGVVLYVMLSGFFPFIGNNDFELHQSIMNGNFPELKEISSDCKDLLYKILEVDPKKRITLNEILLHPWLNSAKSNLNADYGSGLLFTNAERIIYSKLNVDYRMAKKEDLLENFTFKNIDSDLENENQNATTKSIINVPYNTKIRSFGGDDDDDEIFFEDLNIEDSLMKFNPKVNELNRNYEINYNSEADQGVRKKSRRRCLMSSFNNSLNKESLNVKQEEENTKNNQNDCAQLINLKANQNNFGDYTNLNMGKSNKKSIKDTISTNSVTFYVEEVAIKFVEDFGYKREYIMKSLEGNELNHATACYYLKLSLQNE